MNIKKLPRNTKRVSLEGRVLFLCPTSGEITSEKLLAERGYNANSTPIMLVSIPKWCKACHPQPTITWSNSHATAFAHVGEGLEHVDHFDKTKGDLVTDGYYCWQCHTLYITPPETSD